jgi:hypothetical protein
VTTHLAVDRSGGEVLREADDGEARYHHVIHKKMKYHHIRAPGRVRISKKKWRLLQYPVLHEYRPEYHSNLTIHLKG